MPHSDSTNDIGTTRFLYTITLIIIPLTFGIISLLLGKDINWDLKNYHYYNAYAFLENRIDLDIAPAQLQTYINPIADLPFYWMVKSFPSWVAGFVLGFVHGYNLSLVFLIYWKITNHDNVRQRFLVGLCLVVISAMAPAFISELGNTMHDNLTSLFVLGAVLLLLIASEKMSNGQNKLGLLYLGMAGVVMGMGVGIKPSIVIFAISTAFIFTVFQSSWINRSIGLFIYGLTGLAGGMISAGFWWLEMWKRFQNPFFPFYNHVFKSPYFTTTPVSWSFYLPTQLWEYFLWPLIFTFNSLRVNQFYFFDIRFALLYILFLAWLVVIILRQFHLIPYFPPKNEYGFNIRPGNYLLLFFIFSYILWIRESATYRFIIPLELLTPLCFLILLERIFSSKKTWRILAAGAAVLILLSFRPFNWGRLDWSSSYFTIDTGNLNTSQDTVVVMLGISPMSYVIPEFPSNFRFVRPEGNLFTYRDSNGKVRHRDDNQRIFFTMTKDLLEQQKDSFYILYNKKEPGIQPEESLLWLGITPDIKECFLIKVNTPDLLEMCRISR